MSLSAPVSALGLEPPRTQSALGQPLNLLFPLRLSAGESLNPECLRAEVLAGDIRLPPESLQLRLEGSDEAGMRAVRLHSRIPVTEPIISVSLSLGCPVRITRQFTAFVDPLDQPLAPGSLAGAELTGSPHDLPVQRETLASAEATQLESMVLASAVPAPATAATSLPPAEPAKRAAATNRHRPQTVKAGKPPKPAAPVAPAVPEVAVSKAVEKPAARLRLDKPEVEVAAVLAAEAPASSPAVDAALVRLEKLEERLLQLQGASQGMQGEMLKLRSQLEEARSERYWNPLVLGLGAALLGLGAACVHLWRSRRGERAGRQSAWGMEMESELRPRKMGAASAVAAAPMPVPMPIPVAAVERVEDVEVHTLGSALGGGTHGLPQQPSSIARETGAGPDQPLIVRFIDPEPSASLPLMARGEPGPVENLIDLEQSIDFFRAPDPDDKPTGRRVPA
jgi:hypothetical protein